MADPKRDASTAQAVLGLVWYDQLGREGDQEVARIGLDVGETAIVTIGRNDHGHAVVDLVDEILVNGSTLTRILESCIEFASVCR